MKSAILKMMFVSLLLFSGCITQGGNVSCPESNFTESDCPACPQCQQCQTCPTCETIDDKAYITSDVYSWGYNPYNENEILFSINIYNYGGKEAKNVEITCKFFDRGTDEEELYTIVMTKTKNIGNIASNSLDQNQINGIISTRMNLDHYYSAYCYPSKCDNCVILNEKIIGFEDFISGTGNIPITSISPQKAGTNLMFKYPNFASSRIPQPWYANESR